MCSSSRFPEAIPLRKITAQSVVKALVKFFTLVGIPRSIQTDQGSNFMSGIFQQVVQQLGIQSRHSSAYHPESQGALEWFHQTLKNMLTSYCNTHGRDWDEGIPLVLFTIREVEQSSLGFSPFELVFGHDVRGPLKLLKEKLLTEDDEQKTSILKYVSSFRERLFEAGEIARDHLKESQASMKTWYDKKTEVREFNPGDKVLLLLPIHNDALKAKYHGPYTVERRVNNLNYIVNTPDRRKSTQLCHVNLMKKYHDRLPDETKPVTMMEAESADDSEVYIPDPEDAPTDEPEMENKVGCSMKLQNSDVLENISAKLSHLSVEQQEDISNLILEYKHMFSDTLGKTDKIYHDVDVGDAAPIKQHHYRLNPVKREKMSEEVKFMLQK